MYLNIVNNLSSGFKRNKNNGLKKIDASVEDVDKSFEKSVSDTEVCYNSIFYGQLTQNWIKVTN